MAQNTWLNIGADKASSNTPDNLVHHTVSGGSAASGDFTVSFDSAVVTSLNIYDTLARAARQRAIQGGLK